jgi:hypothetical protein
MGQQQMLLVILGIIIVGFAIAIGIALFSGQSVASNRDAMIGDLNHLSAIAYQFRISIRQLGGGEGDYSTFTIPSQMVHNNNGTYSVQDAQVNSLTFKATSADNPLNTIVVTIDASGKPGTYLFGGDFQ